MDNTVMHRFSVGQAVNLIPRVLRPAAAGEYEIRRLIPATEADPEMPRYRIKNVAEKHERVASESDLAPLNRSGSVFSGLRSRLPAAGAQPS